MQIIAGDVVISQFAQWLIAIHSACMNCVRSRHSQDSLPSELYGINLRRVEQKKEENWSSVEMKPFNLCLGKFCCLLIFSSDGWKTEIGACGEWL